MNCIGALSFYDSKRSIGEVLFLINIIGVNFEAGNETREKNSDFVAEQNEEWSEKRVVFFISLFSRGREIEV